MIRLKQAAALLAAVLTLLLAGCANDIDADGAAGRIIFWHSYGTDEAVVLQTIVRRFTDNFPDIQVSLVAVPPGEMRTRYVDAARLSLGPDLFIGSSRWIGELAAAGLIREIDRLEPDTTRYLSAAVENMMYSDQLYGLPYALQPVALYYNADVVTDPPTTLDDLLDQAANGLGVAMTTRFDHALWGVQAFGGELFSEDGRALLDQGGFASWLNWLRIAQDSPGMFLNRDQATLMNLFTSGRAVYYVGTPDDLPQLQAAMPETTLRVVPLPGTASNPAGPLLHVDGLMFNPASAEPNARAALLLGQFLTNNENALNLAREIGHVPANRQVRGIDARTYPIVNAFMVQARTAIAMPNDDRMTVLLDRGDQLYRQVLNGVLEVAAAADQITEAVNQVAGFAPTEMIVTTCTAAGELILWHHWTGIDEAALADIADEFERECPAASVELVAFDNAADLLAQYEARDDRAAPHLLLLPDDVIYPLASDGLIQPLARDLLEQFVPQALNTVTYQTAVYGAPLSLHLNVLYYANAVVDDPPLVVDDLLTEATAGRGVALPVGFEQSYWGLPAFGGTLFDDDYRVVANQNNALADWLSWLDTAAATTNIRLDTEPRELVNTFIDGEVAYLVASSRWLDTLIDELGAEAVAVSVLPAGPVAPAAPLLHTEALMLDAALDEAEAELALAFVRLATNAGSQRALLAETGRFPTNVTVEIAAESPYQVVREQLAQVSVLPNVAELQAVQQFAPDLYTDVVFGDAAPSVQAEAFVTAVSDVTDIEPPTALPATRVPPAGAEGAAATEPPAVFAEPS